MDPTTTARCRQRGCVNYGLWHSARDTSHRFRTVHTALAAVTVEKVEESDPWTVWMAPHGEAKVGPLLAPPVAAPGTSHEDYMELRSAVNYALSTATRFNAP
ncbi:hypothetical protein ACQXVK_10180 [Curtobacterium sp. AB451]|uniref:hypothetical protein n=1 Tax=Curtobacterium sp. AB451 TaxID=3422306 RepID=UPI003D32C5F6